MKDDQRQFLSILSRLPARLTVEQTAWVLNCQPHDIPIVVAARLLKPLGNPPANGVKYFATAEVLELTGNTAWLARMTNTIHQHWRTKNSNRPQHSPDDPRAVNRGQTRISFSPASSIDSRPISPP